MAGKIGPGLPLIHGLEWPHGVLAREGGLERMAHRADVNDPVCPVPDGECKRPVLLAQAQAVAIHGGVATEPLVVFRLGAYPFQVNRTKDRRARP